MTTTAESTPCNVENLGTRNAKITARFPYFGDVWEVLCQNMMDILIFKSFVINKLLLNISSKEIGRHSKFIPNATAVLIEHPVPGQDPSRAQAARSRYRAGCRSPTTVWSITDPAHGSGTAGPW
jgi:hypothetical protein